MVKEATLAFRIRAVSMIEAGISIHKVRLVNLSRTRGGVEGKRPSQWSRKWSLPRQSVKRLNPHERFHKI